mmetsp:Transcript_14453/g.40105  ORF Transcript_14453/g.40105 Transcript_14453/m.40105 type:complete len:142 (+) Transcript_14453:1569-1994(+)
MANVNLKRRLSILWCEKKKKVVLCVFVHAYRRVNKPELPPHNTTLKFDHLRTFRETQGRGYDSPASSSSWYGDATVVLIVVVVLVSVCSACQSTFLRISLAFFLALSHHLSHLLFKCRFVLSPHDGCIQIGGRFIIGIGQH